jgi:hypothetical protein
VQDEQVLDVASLVEAEPQDEQVLDVAPFVEAEL